MFMYICFYVEREKGGEAMARVNSVIDDELLRRLRHVLVDEGLSFSEWLRRQALATVEEQERKKRPKGPRKGKKEG